MKNNRLMLSFDATKTDYITPTIDRDIRNIFRAQQIIVEKNIYLRGRSFKVMRGKIPLIKRRTGRLAASLQNPSYRLLKNYDNWIAESNVMLYMRFLDINRYRYKGRQIYNRQIWGILYRNTLPSLKGQCLDDIDNLGIALERAAKSEK